MCEVAKFGGGGVAMVPPGVSAWLVEQFEVTRLPMGDEQAYGLETLLLQITRSSTPPARFRVRVGPREQETLEIVDGALRSLPKNCVTRVG